MNFGFYELEIRGSQAQQQVVSQSQQSSNIRMVLVGESSSRDVAVDFNPA